MRRRFLSQRCDSEAYCRCCAAHARSSSIKQSKLDYYHARATATAQNSHDPDTKVGALLIHGDTGAVISEGYNGFIRGAPDHKLPTTRPDKYEYMMHAELNLICNAVRHGVMTERCIVYCTISPCTQCLRMLWQAGVREFYFKNKYRDFEHNISRRDIRATIARCGPYYKLTIKPRKA